jgi:hypothetical protein
MKVARQALPHLTQGEATLDKIPMQLEEVAVCRWQLEGASLCQEANILILTSNQPSLLLLVAASKRSKARESELGSDNQYVFQFKFICTSSHT